MKGAAAALKGELGGVASQTSAAGATAGAGFGSKFGKNATSSLRTSLSNLPVVGHLVGSNLGLAVLGGFAAVGVGAAIGVGLFKLGASFDAAFDTIQVKTGATGKELSKLKGVFKEVIQDVPTDFGSAALAVGELSARLNLSGEPLEALSEQFLELSRITGTDLAQNIEDVTRLFGDWSVATDKQAETMDKIFRTAQVTGVGINDLAQQVVFFGSPLRQLGFSLDESLALLGKWAKEGVNVETTLGGMRQSLGRLLDPSKQVLDTFAEFPGLLEAFQAAPNVEERFKLIKDRLLELFATGDEADKLKAGTLALDVFGRRAGADILAAFGEGRFDIGPLLKEITEGEGTISGTARAIEDFSEKFGRLKNAAAVAIEPVATKFFNGLTAAMEKLEPVMEKIEKLLKDHPIIVQTLTFALLGLVGAAAVVAALFVGALAVGLAFVAASIWLPIKAVQLARPIWDAAWAGIAAAVRAVWEVLQTIWHAMVAAWDAVVAAFVAAWNAAKAAWDSALAWITSIPGAILDALAALPDLLLGLGAALIGGLLNAAQGKAGEVWNWLSGLGSQVISAIGDLSGLLVNTGKALINGLKQGIIDAAKAVLDTLSDIGADIVGRAQNIFKAWSPSRVFMEIGADVMRGFQIGLDSVPVSLDTMAAAADFGAGLSAPTVRARRLDHLSAVGGDTFELTVNGDVYDGDKFESRVGKVFDRGLQKRAQVSKQARRRKSPVGVT